MNVDVEAQALEQLRRHQSSSRRSRSRSPASKVARRREPLRKHRAEMIEIRADEIAGATASGVPAGLRASTHVSATIASTSRSTRSVNFSPLPENTLMPLSS